MLFTNVEIQTLKRIAERVRFKPRTFILVLIFSNKPIVCFVQHELKGLKAKNYDQSLIKSILKYIIHINRIKY